MDADFLLIQKIKNGDEYAINTFVHKYYATILKYCHVHIRDYGFAEDLTQETFVSFFRTIHKYQHYGKALNYLYIIAGNKCKDFYRKECEITLEQLPGQTENSMDKIEERMDIQLALEALPDEIRETAILYFLQGLKQKEIAKISGIGLALVKYRVRKARTLLGEYLKEERGL